jgi:hypothetical protein
LATQARNASGLGALDDDSAELLDADPVPHMFSSASLQLALPRELCEEVDVPKQVPHFAMTFSTAFSQFDELRLVVLQPAASESDNTNPQSARFMRDPHEKVISEF